MAAKENNNYDKSAKYISITKQKNCFYIVKAFYIKTATGAYAFFYTYFKYK